MTRHFAILLFFTVLLNGCAKTATDIAIESTKTQVEALEKTLTADCKTDGVKAQLYALKTQITSISKSCESDIKAIKAERNSWIVAFCSLLSVVLLLTIRKRF